MYNLFEPVHYTQCPVLQVLLPILPVHSKRIVFVSVSSFLLVDKNKHKRTFYMLLFLLKLRGTALLFHHCTLTIHFVNLLCQYYY